MAVLSFYLSIGSCIILLIAALMIFIMHRVFLNDKTMFETVKKNENLDFETINTVIDFITTEVLSKYALFYRLKEISIIPKMEDEVLKITKEIIESFSPTINEQIGRFYTKEYFYAMVTRKVQLYLVDYTDKHKPSAK